MRQLLFIIIIFYSTSLLRSETVISIPVSQARTTAFKPDGGLAYSITAPTGNINAAWRLDEITIRSLKAPSWWDTSSAVFTMQIFSGIIAGQFQKIGQEKQASLITGISDGYFSASFLFTPDNITIPENGGFFYNIKCASSLLTIDHAAASSNYGSGWGASDMTSIDNQGLITGVSYWGNSTPVLSLNVTQVPEPSALSLLAVGLGGLAILRRRRS